MWTMRGTIRIVEFSECEAAPNPVYEGVQGSRSILNVLFNNLGFSGCEGCRGRLGSALLKRASARHRVARLLVRMLRRLRTCATLSII